jgi:hypothetical protein
MFEMKLVKKVKTNIWFSAALSENRAAYEIM